MLWLPLPGFDFAGLVVWLLLARRSWEPASRSTPFSCSVTFWRLCGASWSPPLVPSLTAECLGLWPSGLAIAALPLVSRPWTGLCWSDLMSLSSVSIRSWCYRASWLARVCYPASPICPTSSIMKWSSFGLSVSVSCQVFTMRSPFRVECVSVLDRNIDSSSTFLVFGWSLRNEVTLSGRVCLSSRSNEDSSCSFPSGWCHAFAMGSSVSGCVAHFCALDRNEGFFRSSILSCFAMGSPYRSCVFFSHSIVTKSTLDSWSVFLQDGVTPVGSGSDDLISNEGITTVGLVLGVSLCHPLVGRSALKRSGFHIL